VVNIFHAGDGNLHPLLLFDLREPGVRERAIAAGFAAHATKPLNPDELVELIAKLSV